MGEPTNRKQRSGRCWVQHYFTKQVLTRHQQFFKVTYWVTTSIDYINGLPLEKESNYIFVRTAKCRLISNFLGSSIVLFLSWVTELRVGRANIRKEAGDSKGRCPFTQHARTKRRAFSVHRPCSRCRRYRREGDNVSFHLEFPTVWTTPRPIKSQMFPNPLK